jgi:hypothetical protein
MERSFRHVTPVASHRFVRVDERIAREIVVEGFAIELHDVGISTLMIGMTMSTFLFQCVELTSMEFGMLLAIGSDLLMAVDAKL